jgi:hypothetical protein
LILEIDIGVVEAVTEFIDGGNFGVAKEDSLIEL